jgi:hypothetical protein
MYLPKIWGNTRRLHRSVVLGGALGCACTTLPGREEIHTIGAHWASTACAPTSKVTYDLEALGDFPPTMDTSEFLEGEKRLVVPAATRSVSLSARDSFTDFLGLGLATDTADIDVALWPSGSACEVPVQNDDCGYPGAGQGYAIGVSADGRTLLVAGGDASRAGDDAARAAASGAVTVDLGTGKVRCIPASRGLQFGRAGATISTFGSKLLVAGGYDPIDGTSAPFFFAEVYDPETRAFDAAPVGIHARARHGAVTLASGEVLLVGGVDDRSRPLDSIDAIDPDSRGLRKGGVSLETARVDPVVLRLSDDRVFIGGGTDGGSPEKAVQGLEWLDATATARDRALDALACPGDQASTPATVTVKSAFAGMPGGAVLAVGGCDLPADGVTALDCSAHCEGDLGCPSSEVFWIDADANVTCCGGGRAACSGLPVPAIATPFDGPRLLAGEEGRPWLLDGAAGGRTLRRFDPWTAQFPISGTALNGAPAAVASADAGLFLFMDGCDATSPSDCVADLRGLRHGVRGPYTQAVAPLLLANTEGVALDRAPAPPPAPGAAPSRPSRDPTNGAVYLTPGAAMVLTDTTYADVHVVVHVTGGAPPLLRLGEASFGGKSCPWPVRAPQTPFDADLVRRGGRITLSIGTHSQSPCDGPANRVSIVVAADRAAVTVGSVTVARLDAN